VNCDDVGNHHWREYWPGTGYVNRIGIDGYNWGTTQSWSNWRTFKGLFSPVYNDMASFGLPFHVCEVGCAEKGGSKANWITTMGARLADTFPNIRWVNWFNQNKETDWRVESSATSLAAFKTMVANPHFGA
jgi:beta-mannanase